MRRHNCVVDTTGSVERLTWLKATATMLGMSPTHGRFVGNLIKNWKIKTNDERLRIMNVKSERVLLKPGDCLETQNYSRASALFTGNRKQNRFQSPSVMDKLSDDWETDRSCAKKCISELDAYKDLIFDLKVKNASILMFGSEGLMKSEQMAIMRTVQRALEEHGKYSKTAKLRMCKPVYHAVVSPTASEFDFAIIPGEKAKI